MRRYNQDLNFGIFLILFLSFVGCQQKRTLPDISDIHLSIPVHRFERDFGSLKSLPQDKIQEEILAVNNAYPEFFPFYVENLMQFTSLDRPSFTDDVYKFVTDTSVIEILDSIKSRWPKTSHLEAELTNAFKYQKHYLPELNVPKVVSYLGGFGPAALTLDSIILGINLDMHLGSDVALYDFIGMPQYQTRNLAPDKAAVHAVKVWIQQHYSFVTMEAKMIDQMIYNGKILHVGSMFLPNRELYEIMEIEADEWDWCTTNEIDIWRFFLSQELLYETESNKYSKFVTESAFTPGMPKESPGNIGSYIGWQIVKAYLNRNPDVSLDQFLRNNNSQSILTASKYKPKNR